MKLTYEREDITQEEWRVFDRLKRLCDEEDVEFVLDRMLGGPLLPSDITTLNDIPQDIFNRIVDDYSVNEGSWYEDLEYIIEDVFQNHYKGGK